MPYMMTGTVGAEMCNILEIKAQGRGDNTPFIGRTTI
jgi:hypothetical protein